MVEPPEPQSEAPTVGWRTIETAPDTDADVSVWVVGGQFVTPTMVRAEGDYWRFEATTLPGSTRIPILWHPAMDNGAEPESPKDETIQAHRTSIPEDETAAIRQARQIFEELVPHTSTPMVYVGFLRMCGGIENNNKADRIEKTMHALLSR
jgi:hypothetical protein